MSAPDNPPAFPRDERYLGHNGMTLRDYFAGQAIAGRRISNPRLGDDDVMAAWAYAVADAMLVARQQGRSA